MSDNSETLLRAILATIARQTFPPDRLASIIAPKGKSDKQYRAFNMCDGTKTQQEIAKALGFDKGNFSRVTPVGLRLGLSSDSVRGGTLSYCMFTRSWLPN